MELYCRFCKKSLNSGSKRVNSVPVFGVSKNKELLVLPGQDSVIVAKSLENFGFPLKQGEDFSELSCMPCALQAVRLEHSVSVLTSRCNEPSPSMKGDVVGAVSPERDNSSTKRSAALRSPAGITPSAKRNKDEGLNLEEAPHSSSEQSTSKPKTSRRSLSFNQKASKEKAENAPTLEETVVKVSLSDLLTDFMLVSLKSFSFFFCSFILLHVYQKSVDISISCCFRSSLPIQTLGRLKNTNAKIRLKRKLLRTLRREIFLLLQRHCAGWRA